MASRMLKDPERIHQIINKCEVCYLGMVDEQGAPYVLPFNFGYEQGIIYLHSAGTGRKIEILKQNPQVCVSFSTDHEPFHRHEPVACSYGMRYRSALAFGKVVFIEDYQEKERILNVFMRKYAGREFSFNAPAVNNVAIYKVEIARLEGKESGY